MIDKMTKLIMPLQAYVLKAKTSINVIKCYITPDDYKKVEYLVNEICQAIELFCTIEDQMVQEHIQFRQLLIDNNGLVSDEALVAYNKKTAELSQKLIPAYENNFQKLYDIKRDIFDRIYSEIDVQADQILKFTRRGGQTNAHS